MTLTAGDGWLLGGARAEVSGRRGPLSWVLKNSSEVKGWWEERTRYSIWKGLEVSTSRIRGHYLSGATVVSFLLPLPLLPLQKTAPLLRDPGRMGTSVIWIFSFVKCLLASFVHLFIWLPVTLVLLLVYLFWGLCFAFYYVKLMFCIQPLYQSYVLIVFSTYYVTFSFSMISSHMTLILMSNISLFAFMVNISCAVFKKSFPSPRSWRYFTGLS